MRAKSCPLSGRAVLDEYFLEVRAQLLDVAAFLDRIDRSQSPEEAANDPRAVALRQALRLLGEAPTAGRARALQQCFSDPSSEPIPSAAGMKGAAGAYMGGQP